MEPKEPELELEAIGHALREALASESSEDDQIRQARTSFVDEIARENYRLSSVRGRRRQGRRWLQGAFAATVCAAAATLWLWSRPASFEVGESRPGQLGDVVESPDGRTTPIHFSEGSSLLLHGSSRMRVLSLAPEAQRVVVEDGVLDASIAHPKGRKVHWSFEAGSYRVVVTGTKFQLSFSARDQSLRVATQEGQVVVSGGCEAAPKKVSAGQKVDLSCSKRNDLAPSDQADKSSSETQAAEEPQADSLPVAAPSQLAANDLAWRSFLASGRLSEGLLAADRAGFQRVSQVATAQELLALADAARLYSSRGRAVALLRLVRQRFPGTKEGATSAFKLGLTAFEAEHAYAEASKWFETYLREQPSGPLMGDAFGRLIKSKSLAGDLEGAQKVAEQYLRRFPKGPYASEARGILSR
jgi:hypothetical protein